jgi:hypothetical protein
MCMPWFLGLAAGVPLRRRIMAVPASGLGWRAALGWRARFLSASPSLYPLNPQRPPPLALCSIKAAGGFLIQVLPFAEDETIAQVG